MIETLRGSEALSRLLNDYPDVNSVLDVGSGTGEHAAAMRAAGKTVTTISMQAPADIVGDYTALDPYQYRRPGQKFDAIWASHVLEHQRDVGVFLARCFNDLRDFGVLAITVPPPKPNIVGGHLTLWNQGLLLYQLIVAGFDCRAARVSPPYSNKPGEPPYNLSVIVRKDRAALPALAWDHGDVDRLAEFFPMPVAEGFDGRLEEGVNWDAMAAAEPADEPAAGNPGLHIVIIGLGPSAEAYVDHVKRIGDRHAFADEVWAINGMASVLDCDLCFHMDDVRIQEIRARAKPLSNIAAMLRWMKTTSVPVMTSFAHPDYPTTRSFPLEDVVNELGRGYFNNTAAYALAWAIVRGATKISLFGCDYTYPDAHKAEKGRACLEFWLGYAAKNGIEFAVPSNTSLMDGIEDASEDDVASYGYDAVRIKCERDDAGHMKLTFTPRDRLPTAAEIERSYDHGRPIAQQHLRKA